ncbi:MAG: arsenite S-adenosylmethyltransferase [Phycisphaeraceae bacterium]|nr:MAG: arsenite S-adenosylmethyltransferase [Phycisphaeraceae bacterium]
MSDDTRTSEQLRDKIRGGYAQIAEAGVFVGEGSAATRDKLAGGSGCCGGGSCCGPTTLGVDELAEQIGYTTEELGEIPGSANMGLSCGNPTAIAKLREGETVVDLGSGGGFDVFLAGPKVGASGRAIGVDMTAEMIAKARANADQYRERTGLDNVEFRLGEIENLPLPDASADVVISNCVLNLSTDKARAWREMLRVLKPGGRVAVSDIALLAELPEGAKKTVEDWVGCVAGAVLVEDMRAMLAQAGFVGVELTPKPEYVRAMTEAGDPLYRKLAGLLPGGDPAAYVTSLDIVARRPG